MTERFPYALIAVLAIVIIALAGISFTISPFFAGTANEGVFDLIIFDGKCNPDQGTADLSIQARDNAGTRQLEAFTTDSSGATRKLSERIFLNGDTKGDFTLRFDPAMPQPQQITIREINTGTSDLFYC